MNKGKWFITLWVIALVAACSPLVPTNEVLISETLTPQDKMVPSETNTPFQQPSFTSTPAITTTPLSLQEAYQVLQGLYEDNGGCQLPCYWGIVPGKTLWSDASALLASLGAIYGPRGTSRVADYAVSFERFDDPIGFFVPRFWVENGVVKAIGVNSSWISRNFDYSLSGLLQSFGVPEEIWIRPIAESHDGQPFYDLVLFYPSKGILVNFDGNAELQAQYMNICPQDFFSRSNLSRGYSWSSKEQVSFDSDFGKRLVDDDLGWEMDEYRLLQDVSPDRRTNAEFYDTYSDPDTESCIKILPVR